MNWILMHTLESPDALKQRLVVCVEGASQGF